MNNNQEGYSDNNASQQLLDQSKRKTGPSPKYGPDQAKKMVSMRLSPDALQSIKNAAEKVFRDSQADVIERVMRFLPVELLESIHSMSVEYNMPPNEILEEALNLFRQNKNN